MLILLIHDADVTCKKDEETRSFAEAAQILGLGTFVNRWVHLRCMGDHLAVGSSISRHTNVALVMIFDSDLNHFLPFLCDTSKRSVLGISDLSILARLQVLLSECRQV